MNKIENEKPGISNSKSFLSLIAFLFILTVLSIITGCGEGQGGDGAEDEVKKRTREPQWGPEVNGVRVGFEFYPLKESYEIGETIGTIILVKNVTDKPILRVKATGHSFFGHCVITPLDPNTPEMAQVNWLQRWGTDPNQIMQPGEVLAYKGGDIISRSFNPDGTYPPRKAPNMVYFFPGEYLVGFWFECDRSWKLMTGREKLVMTEAKE